MQRKQDFDTIQLSSPTRAREKREIGWSNERREWKSEGNGWGYEAARETATVGHTYIYKYKTESKRVK